eukprot:2013232-Rhodomonas_salina.3
MQEVTSHGESTAGGHVTVHVSKATTGHVTAAIRSCHSTKCGHVTGPARSRHSTLSARCSSMRCILCFAIASAASPLRASSS